MDIDLKKISVRQLVENYQDNDLQKIGLGQILTNKYVLNNRAHQPCAEGCRSRNNDQAENCQRIFAAVDREVLANHTSEHRSFFLISSEIFV